MKVIRDAPGPLRPLDILELASRMVPTLGLATVYRHLNRLQDDGELQAVELGSKDVRYEPTDRGHHHHFVCRECGEAYDVHGCLRGIAKLAPPGFEVEQHEITLHGRCSHCRAGQNEETAHAE